MAARVQCVRVACLGESSLDWIHTTQYSTYNIQPDHEIFRTGELSLLSMLAGVPLLLLKLRPSLLTSSVIHADRARGLSATSSTATPLMESTSSTRLRAH